jgi:hypothetical protein
VILFQHVIFVLTGAVINVRAEFLGNGLGVAGVSVGGDPLGLDLGNRPGGAEECLGRGHIAGFAEINVDQGAVAVDRPVEIAPCAGDLDICFIDVPAPAGFAGPVLAQAPSASNGASLASQSRTASWVNTRPRIRNIYRQRR